MCWTTSSNQFNNRMQKEQQPGKMQSIYKRTNSMHARDQLVEWIYAVLEVRTPKAIICSVPRPRGDVCVCVAHARGHTLDSHTITHRTSPFVRVVVPAMDYVVRTRDRPSSRMIHTRTLYIYIQMRATWCTHTLVSRAAYINYRERRDPTDYR